MILARFTAQYVDCNSFMPDSVTVYIYEIAIS